MAAPSGAVKAAARLRTPQRSAPSSASGCAAAPVPNSASANPGWRSARVVGPVGDDAAFAGLPVQPLRRAGLALHHVVVEVDRPAQYEHDVADHVLVLVGARPGGEKA